MKLKISEDEIKLEKFEQVERGKRIKHIRENELKMNKTQFAKLIGVSGQFLGLVEEGKGNLVYRSIRKLRNLSGHSADYILYGIDDNVINKTPVLIFDIETEGAKIELPRLYYLGYDIKLNSKQLSYKENKNGFIELYVKESGTITVKYAGTTGYKVALALFVGSVIIIIGYFVFTNKKRIKYSVKKH